MKMMIFLLAHDKLPRSLSTQVCDTDEECMLYCRYVSAQRYSEALDLLHSGACIQLEHGQVNTLVLPIIHMRHDMLSVVEILTFFLFW